MNRKTFALLALALIVGAAAGVFLRWPRAATADEPSKNGFDRKAINPPGLYDASKWYAHVVKVRGGTTVFIAGQVAYNEKKELIGKGDLSAQAVRAFKNLKTALRAGGASPADVVKINVYIVNYKEDKIGVLEEGLNECFGKDRNFASTVVGVQALARDELLIEVEAVAVVP